MGVVLMQRVDRNVDDRLNQLVALIDRLPYDRAVVSRRKRAAHSLATCSANELKCRRDLTPTSRRRSSFQLAALACRKLATIPRIRHLPTTIVIVDMTNFSYSKVDIIIFDLFFTLSLSESLKNRIPFIFRRVYLVVLDKLVYVPPWGNGESIESVYRIERGRRGGDGNIVIVEAATAASYGRGFPLDGGGRGRPRRRHSGGGGRFDVIPLPSLDRYRCLSYVLVCV